MCPTSSSVLTQAEGDTSITAVSVAAGVAGLATISQVQRYKVHLLPHFYNSPRPPSGFGLSSLIQEHFSSGPAFATEEHFFWGQPTLCVKKPINVPSQTQQPPLLIFPLIKEKNQQLLKLFFSCRGRGKRRGRFMRAIMSSLIFVTPILKGI